MLWVVWQTFAIGWTDRQTDRETWKGLIGGYSDKRDTTAQKLLSTTAFHGLLLRTCSYLYNKSQTSTTTNRYVFMYTSDVVTTHDHQ